MGDPVYEADRKAIKGGKELHGHEVHDGTRGRQPEVGDVGDHDVEEGGEVALLRDQRLRALELGPRREQRHDDEADETRGRQRSGRREAHGRLQEVPREAQEADHRREPPLRHVRRRARDLVVTRPLEEHDQAHQNGHDDPQDQRQRGLRECVEAEGERGGEEEGRGRVARVHRSGEREFAEELEGQESEDDVHDVAAERNAGGEQHVTRDQTHDQAQELAAVGDETDERAQTRNVAQALDDDFDARVDHEHQEGDAPRSDECPMQVSSHDQGGAAEEAGHESQADEGHTIEAVQEDFTHGGGIPFSRDCPQLAGLVM